MEAAVRPAWIGLALAVLVAAVAVQPSPAQETVRPIAPQDRLSGSAFMSAEARALQADDASNPAMLWVKDGEDIWARKTGVAERSCADCHGEAGASMKGVAARYPAFDPASQKPVTLDQRINICRTINQKAEPFAPESQPALAIASYVGLQSRGMPITPPDDKRLKPFLEAGRSLFGLRQGQLNLSCANCHDALWGGKLGGSPIPQAHPTGYPIYRLEWQGIGSLQRRLRNCMTGVRAEPFAPNSIEFTEIELYLAERAKGMTVETPAIRP
ncbi:MAG: sulfur oxidation c-type cytochrome SoxA [Beijerinckiaceae bacterium]|nr:sulfur oxidation c-type cytochrome SoxA [Beijerinckiaceae bacterium]